MFFHDSHKELFESIEAIGASFAVYEYNYSQNIFTLITCNSLYEDLLGKKISEVLNKPLEIIFPRYISKPLLNEFIKCKTSQKAIETEILLEYKNEERWWRSILSPIIENINNKLRIIQTCVEITEKKLLEKKLHISMKRYEAVVETAYDGIITIDESQNIKLINEAAKQIFAIKNEKMIGTPLTSLIPQKYRKKHIGYVESFKNSLIDSRPMQSRAAVRGLRRDGLEFPIEVTISKIKVDNKIEMTAVIRDISEKSRLLEELLIASQEDPLTQLYNRRHFTKSLQAELSRLKRFNRAFVLIMIDIDFFKAFNDDYGHECGDQVLTQIAQLLKLNLRDTDLISRWGGEEFLVLLPETDLEHGLQIAEKLRSKVETENFIYKNQKLNITISLGVKYCTNTKLTIDTYIDYADKALYKAKTQGRNKVVSDKE